MTLYECYQRRKDALFERLTRAKSLAEGSAAMCETLDGALYDYSNDCEDDELRELAAGMSGAVKTSLPLLECASDTKIWESTAGGEKVKRPKWPGFVSLALGAGLIAGVVYVFFAQRPELAADDLSGAAMLLAFGALLIFVAGVLLMRAPALVKPEKTEKQVDVKINAADAVRRLAAVFLQMDKSLDARRAALASKNALERAQGLAPAELELFSALLEGAYSGDGELALDSLAETEHYLRRRGIETRSYDKKNEEYFELLPAERDATLRPALLCDGRLIKKGLAAYGEGERT